MTRGGAALAAAALGLSGFALLALAGGRPQADPGQPALLVGVSPAGPARCAEDAPPAPAPAAPRGSAPLEVRAATPAVPVSDDLPQVRDAPREGSEAAHYARFIALGQRHDGSLAAAAGRVLDGQAPSNERVALLRALWDCGPADAAPWFAAALAAPGEGSASEAAVPDFAVRFLAERAPREPDARMILSRYLAAPPAGCDAGRLARAAGALEPLAIASDTEP